MFKWISSYLKKPSLENYKGAGCIFTNDNHVLAGYQVKQGVPFIGGLGGTRKEGETFLRTALRETLEELFEVNIPESLLTTLELRIVPIGVHLRGSYVLVHYTFHQLDDIISLSEPFCKNNPFYAFYPRSCIDLIVNRTKNAYSEVSTLCLLPLETAMFISPEFMGDLQSISSI